MGKRRNNPSQQQMQQQAQQANAKLQKIAQLMEQKTYESSTANVETKLRFNQNNTIKLDAKPEFNLKGVLAELPDAQQELIKKAMLEVAQCISETLDTRAKEYTKTIERLTKQVA